MLSHTVAAKVLIAAVIVLAAIRSSWATRLDGFTIDEPWHITAGVAHVRVSDFRLNPEQGPLVKLWIGAVFGSGVFQLPAFRKLNDKYDERLFTEDAVYGLNDPYAALSRARIGMLVFTSLLLASFAWAVWRSVGPGLAAATTAFLAIDPTIAAHLPVVMTDLSTAILSISAVMLAAHALRTQRGFDYVAASVFLGLALGSKHSALTAALFVAAMAAAVAIARRSWCTAAWSSGLFAFALLILWSLFRFHYWESGREEDAFNRPLKEKIEDIHAPATRAVVEVLDATRIVPRAYLWGLADTIHEGIEGRSFIIHAFGRSYDRSPWYLFPGLLAVKIPLGLLALSFWGVWLAARRPIRSPAPWALYAALGYGFVFLVLLMPSGAYYAGVRHALRCLLALALLGGYAIEWALCAGLIPRLVCAAALLTALVEALPAVRPWEYHNALAGNTAGAYRYFSNEGVDLGQRTRELADYYRREVEPRGEVAYLLYDLRPADQKRRGIRAHYYGSPEGAGDQSVDLTGTFLVGTTEIAITRRRDYEALRFARPVARFGNLLVYRGTFHLPEWRAWNLTIQAMDLLYSEKPDPDRARVLFEEVIALRPMMVGPAVELGNMALKRGDGTAALSAYRTARQYAPPGDPVTPALDGQLSRLQSGQDPQSIPAIRNPWME